MIRNFADIKAIAKKNGPKKISVVCPHDIDILQAVEEAKNQNIADSILVGDEQIISSFAKEKVTEKMPATIDAAKLEEMNKNGEISGCIVGGPFALDNAVSLQAAEHKGIQHPVAGNSDILMVPNIEAGNILYKSMVFFSPSLNAGLVMGANAPIIVPSRADSTNTKLNSIAMSVLLASNS